MSRREVAAWGSLALLCFLLGTVVALGSIAEVEGSSLLEDVVYSIEIAVVSLVGFLLARRVPASPIGWLLLAQGAVLALSGIAYGYAEYALGEPGSQAGARFSAVWDTHGWPLIFAPLVAIVYVFPDGRLPSYRWRAIAVGGAMAFTITIVAGVLGSEPLDSPFTAVEPYGILSSGVSEALQGFGLLGMIVTLILGVVAVRARFRRGDLVERLQLKWLLYASALIPIAIICGTIDGLVLDGDGSGALTEVPFIAASVAIPVAVGIAVTRYRLYDIDRLISATVLYVILTGLLAGAFVGIILLGGVAIGGESQLTTAVATLAVTLAFRPLRAWLQTLVDRRFNRERYEAMEQVGGFLSDLRQGRVEPEEVGTVLATAFRDPDLRLYFWLPERNAHADAAGRLAELPTGVRTPVTRGEVPLATIVHGSASDPSAYELGEIIARAGMAIEIARLRVEVRRQLAEVEDSRARIVSATHEERRRLERDLHDGAQQRLVSIGLDLRHLQGGLDESDPAREGLDAAVRGLTDAISELRELAGGVRPATLDAGLAAALADLASRAPVRTRVHATPERFPDEVEAAAYFVASEALTNAVKHANAAEVTLSATRENEALELSIRDDGCGGATPLRGSGLTGLADRVAAVGGRFAIESPAGRGTKLVAEFPCE